MASSPLSISVAVPLGALAGAPSPISYTVAGYTINDSVAKTKASRDALGDLVLKAGTSTLTLGVDGTDLFVGNREAITFSNGVLSTVDKIASVFAFGLSSSSPGGGSGSLRIGLTGQESYVTPDGVTVNFANGARVISVRPGSGSAIFGLQSLDGNQTTVSIGATGIVAVLASVQLPISSQVGSVTNFTSAGFVNAVNGVTVASAVVSSSGTVNSLQYDTQGNVVQETIYYAPSQSKISYDPTVSVVANPSAGTLYASVGGTGSITAVNSTLAIGSSYGISTVKNGVNANLLNCPLTLYSDFGATITDPNGVVDIKNDGDAYITNVVFTSPVSVINVYSSAYIVEEGHGISTINISATGGPLAQVFVNNSIINMAANVSNATSYCDLTGDYNTVNALRNQSESGIGAYLTLNGSDNNITANNANVTIGSGVGNILNVSYSQLNFASASILAGTVITGSNDSIYVGGVLVKGASPALSGATSPSLLVSGAAGRSTTGTGLTEGDGLPGLFVHSAVRFAEMAAGMGAGVGAAVSSTPAFPPAVDLNVLAAGR